MAIVWNIFIVLLGFIAIIAGAWWTLVIEGRIAVFNMVLILGGIGLILAPLLRWIKNTR